MAWLWIILALIYIISPYDLLPDFFLPIGGWLDDTVILFLVIRYIARYYRSRPTGGQNSGRKGPYEQTRNDRHAGFKGDGGPSQKNPYTILGVSSNATQQEIQRAYRKLAKQYHPDKVAHLGKDLQDLAEKRFKDIQNAYDQLKVQD